MATIIKADSGAVSGVAGLSQSSDNSGVLEFQATSGIVTAGNITGALGLPVGTTAQRPVSPAAGYMRYNTTNNEIEFYTGSSWVTFTARASGSYSVEALIVAGGGGSGYGNNAGGGGAGGMVEVASRLLLPGTSYSIVIGSGGSGTGGIPNVGNGTSGSNSSFDVDIALGGGRASGDSNINGADGGSGGGGGFNGSSYGSGGAATQGNTPNGIGYGNAGRGGVAAGTGGGAGQSGAAGGAGRSNSITGTAVTYAIGGYGTGGAAAGQAGTANRGNGAGSAMNGGSGIVVIRYLGTQRGTGGTVTTSGGYTIHTFTSSGTFTA